MIAIVNGRDERGMRRDALNEVLFWTDVVQFTVWSGYSVARMESRTPVRANTFVPNKD
jgi:hypothetical protein